MKSAIQGRMLLAGALLSLSLGCSGFQHVPWINSQRQPGPMENRVTPLPPGEAALFPPGPEEVRVVRHADPVQVRTAGNAGSFPLSHQRKEIRVFSGSGVSCAAGGRAEILWPDGGSVILFGRTAGIVGSVSRGEPSFILRDLERAQFDPASEDLFELIGGAQLRARAGPVRVSRVREDVLRVSNQSKRDAQVAYRQETIVLDPGQAVDLPLLSSGGRPTRPEARAGVAQGRGFTAEHEGDASLEVASGEIVARGRGTVRALGVAVRLDGDVEARFAGHAPPSSGESPPSSGEALPPAADGPQPP